MRTTIFGDLAYLKVPLIEANNMVSGHFSASQMLSLSPPSSGPLASLIPARVSNNYQLHWVFYAEYLKLDNIQKDKLKLTNFDFSKYFYVLQKSDITRVTDLGNPPINIQTYGSGGSGEIDFYNLAPNFSGDFNPLAIRILTSSILEARGLVFEDLPNLNPEQIKVTFNSAEIQFFSEKHDLQNFNTALLQP